MSQPDDPRTLDPDLPPEKLPDAPPPDTFPDPPQIALDLGVTTYLPEGDAT